MRKNILLGGSVLAAPFIGHLSAYASANTLTGLFPDLFAAVDVVSRELVGMIPSVTRNANAERAAVGQNVTYPITPQMGTFNVTPAMAVPEPADVTIGNGAIVITKSKGVEFGWTGEEQRALNTGVGYLTVQADLFAQGLRTLVNEIEADLFVAGAAAASGATGTPGTTPFASTVGDSAQVRKLLDDRGAPATGRSLVGDTSMGAALRTLQNLTRVNEAGTAMTLRDGELLNLNGLSIKESAGAVQTTVTGTAAGATTNNAGYAKGATTITLASAGTGSILAGDFISFAGDPNKYRVVTGDADVSGGGTVVLAAPGLMEAIPAAATAITVASAAGGYTRNLGFAQSAIHLVARAPALPQQGDLALDRILITDPRSGLTFEVSLYPGYRKVRAEVAMAWGVKAVKGEHIVALLG
ncbi:major capsid protein [Rhizobium phage RHph_X2_24]|nr:major capsid protein [Rhizobium phage RHph_X2_24]